MPKFIAESNASGTITATDATASSDVVNLKTLTRAGFENHTQSTMSFNTSTLTFTIGPTGSYFQVWANNTRFTKVAATGTVVSGGLSGERFVFFNAAGDLTSSAAAWTIDSDQTAPVALIYLFSGTSAYSATWADERHSAIRDRTNHRYLHNTRGTAYESGLSCSFTNVGFTASSGRVWDEDILSDITASQSASIFYYRSGSTNEIIYGTTASYYHITGTLQYDNNGVFAPVGNGNFVNSWIYATTDANYPITIVMGQAEYASVGAALAGPLPTVPSRTTREWKLIWQSVWRYSGGNITFSSATDWRTASNLPSAGGVGSLPASSITYIPTAPLTATNVQSALNQVANSQASIFGGLYGDYGPASLAGAGDPTFAVFSGVFQAVSASLTAAMSSTNGYCSASITDGRIYVGVPGIYRIHCDSTMEIGVNTLLHLGIFITGTEYPRYSQAVDMTSGNSYQFSVGAIAYLASGSYVDIRVRKGAAASDTITLHHFNLDIYRLAVSGS